MVTIGILGAAALVPVVLTAGAGAGAIALAIAGLVGNVGESIIGNVVDDAVRRRRAHKPGREVDENQLRASLQQDILKRLESSGADAAAMRQELSALLRSVGGLEAALAGASAELRGAITERLIEVGETLVEFAWMLDEIRARLADIQDRQAVQLEMQHVQLALSREQLAKTNELLERRDWRRELSPDDEVYLDPASSPYMGLEVFQAGDADFFFGRERVVAELSARLAEAPFLAVVGASGSGKSSVVRAGLVPAILQRRVARSDHWRVAVLTPGPRPLEQLALRAAVELQVSPTSMLTDLRANPRSFDLAVRGVMLDEPEDARLVLIVDQLEEIFTLCRDNEDRAQFIEALVGGLRAGTAPITVVVTLRADFYGRCGDYPELAALLQDHQVVVGAMTSHELLRAIEGPAERVGATLEPGLAETILGDLEEAPGALPLLSHALFETWTRREGRALTLAAYRAAGGVREAIARSAERVYCHELTEPQRGVARAVFLRLTQLGEGTEDTRRPAAPAELEGLGSDGEIVEAVLGTLVRARLVTVGDDEVELAHEALLREWPRLRGWLNDDREGHRTRAHLTRVTNEWIALDRDPAVLYRGSRLVVATAWASDHPSELTADEREFLAHSQRAELAEQQRARAYQRLRRLVPPVLGTALLIAVVLAVFAFSLYRRAADERRTSQLRALAISAPTQIESDPALSSLLSVAAFRAEPSSDGRDAVVRATEGTAGVIGVLPGHYTAAEISPDGATVALACADGRIRIWEVRRRRMLTRAPPCDGTNPLKIRDNDIAFAASGRVLAATENERTLEVWDVSRPDSPRRVARAGFQIDSVLSDFAISPDGGTVAAVQSNGTDVGLFTGEGSLVLWDVRSGRVTPVRVPPPIDELAFTPDGRELLMLADATVLRLDLRRQRWKPRLELPDDCCDRSAIDPTGRYVAAENHAAQLTVWDVRTRTRLRRWARGEEPSGYGIAVEPGQNVVLGNYFGAQRYRDGRVPERLGGHRGSVFRVSSSRRGALVTLDNRGTVVVRGPDAEIETALPVRAFDDLAPDGRDGRRLLKRLKALSEYKDTLKESGTPVLSANRERFALVDGRRSQVILGEVKSLRRLASVDFPEGFSLIGAELSHSGGTIAAYGDGVEIRDVRTGARRAVLPRRTDSFVGDVAFTHDDRRAIVAYDSGDLVVWDVGAGRRLGRVIQAHADSSFIAVSTDDSILVSGGRDTSIKLWDLATHRPLGEPITTRLPVIDLVFTRSGSLLVLTESERTSASDLVELTPALTDVDAAATRLCALAGRDLTPTERHQFLPDDDDLRVCRRAG